MASQANLARPYARAAFEYAAEHQQLAEWTRYLQLLATIVEQADIAKLLKNPKFQGEHLVEVVFAVAKKELAKPIQNFVRQLAEKHRLTLLPEIYHIYVEFCLQLEQTVEVQVYSAIPLADDYKRQLANSLNKKLGKRAELHFHIDENLIGGLLIRAGDQVIDSSVRGQLTRMREALVD